MVEQRRNDPLQPEQPKPFGPIEALAERDLEARNKTTGELAADFQKAVEEAKAFSWIGIHEDVDPDLGTPTVEVYLAEKSDRTPEAGEQLPDVVEKFTDLTLSLRPNLDLHLHLIADTNVDILRQDLETRGINLVTQSPL